MLHLDYAYVKLWVCHLAACECTLMHKSQQVAAWLGLVSAGTAAALGQALVPYYTGKIIDYASIEPDSRRFQQTTLKLVAVAFGCAVFTGNTDHSQDVVHALSLWLHLLALTSSQFLFKAQAAFASRLCENFGAVLHGELHDLALQGVKYVQGGGGACSPWAWPASTCASAPSSSIPCCAKTSASLTQPKLATSPAGDKL